MASICESDRVDPSGQGFVEPPQGSSPGSQMHSAVPQTHHKPVIVWPAKATEARDAEFSPLSAGRGEKQSGRSKMHIAATRDLVFTKLSSSKGFGDPNKEKTQSGLYQQFVEELTNHYYTRHSLVQFASGLISQADQSFLLRHFDRLDQICNLLVHLPLPSHYAKIGRYYRALCLKRKGSLLESRKQLELVAEDAPLRYRARALMSMGVADFDSGDCNSALRMFAGAANIASRNKWFDPFTTIATHRNVCILKSQEGDHAGALAELEKMTPVVVSIAGPNSYTFAVHCNSLAVELMEAGRLEEAFRTSSAALASPYASAYPEWRETLDDVAMLSKARRASRSLAAFTRMPVSGENVVRLPLPDQATVSNQLRLMRPKQLARVVNYFDWKKKVQNEPKEIPAQTGASQLTARQMLLRIIDIASGQNMTLEKLNRILKAVEAIASESERRPR